MYNSFLHLNPDLVWAKNKRVINYYWDAKNILTHLVVNTKRLIGEHRFHRTSTHKHNSVCSIFLVELWNVLEQTTLLQLGQCAVSPLTVGRQTNNIVNLFSQEFSAHHRAKWIAEFQISHLFNKHKVLIVNDTEYNYNKVPFVLIFEREKKKKQQQQRFRNRRKPINRTARHDCLVSVRPNLSAYNEKYLDNYCSSCWMWNVECCCSGSHVQHVRHMRRRDALRVHETYIYTFSVRWCWRYLCKDVTSLSLAVLTYIWASRVPYITNV